MIKIFYFSCLNFFLATANLLSQVNYKIDRTIPVEGIGGWDYISVDEVNNRIFVSHSTVAQAIDINTGKIAGTISGTNGIHGIAVANDLNKGFTSNGRDSSVTVFNLRTLEIITKIKVTGRNPDAILYDSFSHRVFTFNGGSNNATVIDAKNNRVLETIPLDGKPEFSVTDDKGNIYVNIEDKSLIDVISSIDLKVIKSWPIAPGKEPSGLAIDKENKRLFSVCGNKLMVISNAETGTVITSLPIGDRCDGVTFDPKYHRAFSSNGEGTITVVQEVDPIHFKVLETIKTQPGARTISVNKTTHHLYLPAAEYESSSANRRPAVKPNTFHILDIEIVK